MEKEQQARQVYNHNVMIDNNKKAVITGVIEVISSTEKAVVAKTHEHTFQIVGDNLRVSKLVLEEKLLHVEGDIVKLEYSKTMQKKNLLKRLFK